MCAKKKPAMLEPDMQDAVIYTRYSSHNQRDCSIEQQVADCEIFARQNNLRVVKVYADRHLSGTTDNRPQGSPPRGRGKARHLSHGLLPCG